MTRVAVVTGANQGLGLALTSQLAQRLSSSDVVYLTGRNEDRVRAAATTVTAVSARVAIQVLDVSDPTAVASFAARIEGEHGGADIVISNAAARLSPHVPSAMAVGEFVATNNLGATAVLRSFAPIVRPEGRLLVVASDFGRLVHLPQKLWPLFEDRTLDELDSTMLAWADEVRAGTAAEAGWPDWINVPSKVGQVAAVRALARLRSDDDARHGILLAAVCPGLVDTAASRPWFSDMRSAQTPDEAATPVVQLALGPRQPAHYGELVQFGLVRPWRPTPTPN